MCCWALLRERECTNWPGVARLTPTGALDTNFNPGSGVNGTVYSLALQSRANQIVIGGSFSQVNHTNLNGVGRLNYNGSVDYSFQPARGQWAGVFGGDPAFDGEIVAGGSLTRLQGCAARTLCVF